MTEQIRETMVLLGGTFDPVHHGHLIIARAVAERIGAERVTLLPAASPPHKAGPTGSGDQRLEMLRLATCDDRHFEICDIELGRSGPSYTIDTVRQLRAKYGQQLAIRLIIGADMLEDLPDWHEAGQLVEEVDFAVAVRPPWSEQMERIGRRLADSFGPERARRLVASAIETPAIEISSTEIRRRIAEGRDIRYLVPLQVAGYIQRENLYAAP